MKKLIVNIYNQHSEIISYIIISLITSIVEFLIAWVLLRLYFSNVVAVNTISVLIGMVLHYLLITKKTFKAEVSFGSVFVYLITFVLGLFIQNSALWLSYTKLFVSFQDTVKLALSKAVSLMTSFVIMYFVRSALYGLIRKKGKK